MDIGNISDQQRIVENVESEGPESDFSIPKILNRKERRVTPSSVPVNKKLKTKTNPSRERYESGTLSEDDNDPNMGDKLPLVTMGGNSKENCDALDSGNEF